MSSVLNGGFISMTWIPTPHDFIAGTKISMEVYNQESMVKVFKSWKNIKPI